VAATALFAVGGAAPAAGPSVSAIAVGYLHACALLSGGAVKCWGANGNGQLSDGTTKDRHSAVPVSGLPTGIRTLVAGGAHTCALLGDASVRCWGDDEYGQLGDGAVAPTQPPKAVSGLAGEVSQVAAGAIHTCAIVTGGLVECWGDNRYGQLGDGTTTSSLHPKPVTALGKEVEEVTAGAFHTCALRSRSVWCWGYNQFGQLGDGTTGGGLTPVPVAGLGGSVQAIAAGAGHTCALLASGGVKCWGDDEYGQLGDDQKVLSEPSPVAVEELDGPVQAIATGFTDTCALLRTGEVQCWGNLFEETAEAVRGLERGATAVAISGDDTYEDHACAIMGAGGAKCWGANDDGQVGNGTVQDLRFTPSAVLGLADGVHVLTVRVNGHGTVTGAAIRCKDQCGYERPQGATVALTAHAAKRSIFKGWSGACKGKRTRCFVALGAELTATARFAKRPGRGRPSPGWSADRLDGPEARIRQSH